MIEPKVNKADIARVFGVTRITIDNWRDDGLPREGVGRNTIYPITDCVKWYADRKVSERLARTKIGNEVLTIKEAQAKKIAFEAALKELELYEVQGNLVRVDRVSDYIDQLITELKNAVLSIPGAWSEQVVGLKTRPHAMKKLDQLSRKLLDHLANGEHEFLIIEDEE